MIKEILSSPNGQLSTMRVMMAMAVVCLLIGFFVVLGCTIWVVLHKDDFPTGMWQALAAIAGSLGTVFGAKTVQSGYEMRSWSCQLPQTTESASARED